MISNFLLAIAMVAAQQLQFNGPFDTLDQCEAVKRQIEREFKPHKAACIEMRRTAPAQAH